MSFQDGEVGTHSAEITKEYRGHLSKPAHVQVEEGAGRQQLLAQDP